MALPYGVKVNVGEDMAFTLKKINENGLCEASSKSRMTCYTKLPLPYLRPMSSMTDEEKVQLSQYACIGEDLNGEFIDEVEQQLPQDFTLIKMLSTSTLMEMELLIVQCRI